jgi:hypothetical protein
MLGWQEESENIKFDTANPHHITDTKQRKIRLNNNLINRPIVLSNVASLQQEILCKRWHLNGDTIIIGEYGSIINGQHSLVALVFANQVWEDKKGQYGHLWPTAPVMEKLVVYGISEKDAVINTVDTTKPRTLADVIFRSPYFESLKQSDRRKVSKIADYAVRTLWERTGAANAYSPRRTHSESLDFIARHPRMLECVKHIYEENGTERRVGQYLSPGRASALMYLMAGSQTEREQEDKKGYSDLQEATDASIKPSENQINFDSWDKASEFWVLLAGGNEAFLPVRAAIADCKNEDGGNPAEFTAIIIKAWLRFNAGKPITAKELALEYADKDGVDVLNETPICGGIDIGKPVV